MDILFFLVLLFLGGFATAFLLVKKSLTEKGNINRSINLDLLLVKVPQDLPEGDGVIITRDQEREWTSVMEQLLATLANLEEKHWFKRLFYPPVSLVCEVATVKGRINFYLAVPKRYRMVIEKQIHGFYPEASIEKVEDYNIFNPSGGWAVADVALKNKYYLPIKTYLRLESDPLNDLANALSKVEAKEVEGAETSYVREGAAIQLVMAPAKTSWQKKGQDVASKMKEGYGLKDAQKKAGADFLGGLGQMGGQVLKGVVNLDTVTGESSSQDNDTKPLTALEDEMSKAIEDKASKKAFRVNIRLVASAGTQSKAEEILESLKNTFEQFEDPNLNAFKLRDVNGKRHFKDYVFRNFNSWRAILLNTEEITSVFHFPIATTKVPQVNTLKAKQSHPPANLPKEGVVLGYSLYRGEKIDVRMKREDRRRHLYYVGQTGTGKSTAMENLAIQDIQNGEGVGFIDPHGSAIEKLLKNIPPERMKDVILFDVGDVERPVGLNILEIETEEDKDFITQEMIQIFYKLVSDPAMIGPIFEHQMRNVMLTLMADRKDIGTIVEIPRMFTDESYQQAKLKNVTDPMVRNFWEQEMAKTNDFHKSEQLGYIISKVGSFVENEMIRNIIGQQKSAINIPDIMDNKKILLANLSKGKAGDLNSKLIGLLLVSKLQMAALGRQKKIEKGEDFPDFYLYIDEFQNYTTDSISVILSEARKYKLCLNMAHQFIAQLGGGQDQKSGNQATIKDAVFGNVGSMVVFRVGVEDAEFLQKQFDPDFSQEDLINIDNFNAHVKLLIDSMVSKPFNMVGYNSPDGSTAVADQVRELSRMTYGVDREKIRKEIQIRANLNKEKKNSLPSDPFAKL